MRLGSIIESSLSRKLRQRIIAAFKGDGVSGRGGVDGVADEFNISTVKAWQYVRLLGGSGYGEGGVDDLVLHRARAPQNIYRLLRHFEVDDSVVSKLINFHVEHRSKINRHGVSPSDDVVFQQLDDGERLIGLVSKPRELIEQRGLVAVLVPWYDGIRSHYPYGVWYVSRPNDVDIIEAILDVYGNELLVDLLHGLGFGYRMVDVFNYVRHSDPSLVDGVCGIV